jgi:hypothetical protein
MLLASVPASGQQPAASALTGEQDAGLREVREMIREAVRLYGSPAMVDVMVASWVGSPSLGAFAEAGAVYGDGRLYLAPAILRGHHRDVLVAVALGSHLLNAPSRARDLAAFERERHQRVLDANAKAVEILTRVKGLPEQTSVQAVAEWLRGQRRDPEVRELLDRFPQHRDAVAGRAPGARPPGLVIVVSTGSGATPVEEVLPPAPASGVTGPVAPVAPSGPGASPAGPTVPPAAAAESQTPPFPPPAFCTPGHRLRYVYRCPATP